MLICKSCIQSSITQNLCLFPVIVFQIGFITHLLHKVTIISICRVFKPCLGSCKIASNILAGILFENSKQKIFTSGKDKYFFRFGLNTLEFSIYIQPWYSATCLQQLSDCLPGYFTHEVKATSQLFIDNPWLLDTDQILFTLHK